MSGRTIRPLGTPAMPPTADVIGVDDWLHARDLVQVEQEQALDPQEAQPRRGEAQGKAEEGVPAPPWEPAPEEGAPSSSPAEEEAIR